MSSLDIVVDKLTRLRDKARATLGQNDLDLSEAVDALVAGYGVSNGCSHVLVHKDNGNRTHTTEVKCLDCGAVFVSSQEDCTDADGDGKCDMCGAYIGCRHTVTKLNRVYTGDGHHETMEVCAECGHVFYSYKEQCTYALEVTPHNNGKHTIIYTCEVCGGLISEKTEDCSDSNYDGKCKYCESPVICKHDKTHITWDYNGDGTHTKITKCRCGDVLETIIEKCSDADGDGRCGYCDGAVKPPCEHKNTAAEIKGNGNGTHKFRTKCLDCGEYIGEYEESCDPRTSYSPNGDETHYKLTACSVCSDVLSNVNEACTDANEDGKCDLCGGAVAKSTYTVEIDGSVSGDEFATIFIDDEKRTAGKYEVEAGTEVYIKTGSDIMYNGQQVSWDKFNISSNVNIRYYSGDFLITTF